MRVFLVWVISAIFILLAITLGNVFGISKHIFTIWFAAIYMIIITIKRYNDEKYSGVISKMIIGSVGLSYLAIVLTVIEIYTIMLG